MSKDETVAAIRNVLIFNSINSAVRCAGKTASSVGRILALKQDQTADAVEHAMEHIVEVVDVCELFESKYQMISDLHLISCTHNERVELFSEAFDDELIQKLMSILQIDTEVNNAENLVRRLEERDFFNIGKPNE